MNEGTGQRHEKKKAVKPGKGISRLEIAVIFILVASLSATFLYGFAEYRKETRRTACAKNLKELGMAIVMYANENKEKFPPVDDRRNGFIFDGSLLYPEYLTDAKLTVCPAAFRRGADKGVHLISNHSDGTPARKVHADCITGDSYVYLGWMVMNEKETRALFEAYDELSADDYDEDITVPQGWGTLEEDTIHRLTFNVDRYIIKDITVTGSGPSCARLIPIMWDRPSINPEMFNHKPAGGNVLYLDGHVEFWEYGETESTFTEGPAPDEFYLIYNPLNETMAQMLKQRPRAPIPYCE